MTEGAVERPYDLGARTFLFAQRTRAFVRTLPRTVSNAEDVKQLVRSSGSVGANYVEADEALSKKDFVMRIRISRKESKESGYWLRLLDTGDNAALEGERQWLVKESRELVLIFSAIVNKTVP